MYLEDEDEDEIPPHLDGGAGGVGAHPPSEAALGSVVASGQHFQVSCMVSATQASPPTAPKAVRLVRCLSPSPCVPQVPLEVLVQLLPASVPVQEVHVVQPQLAIFIEMELVSEKISITATFICLHTWASGGCGACLEVYQRLVAGLP